MGGLRVRWRTVAKVAVLLCAALPALRALPKLFEPAPPPPLAADIGLRHLGPAPGPRSADRTRARVWPAQALDREPRRRERHEGRRSRPGAAGTGPPSPVQPPALEPPPAPPAPVPAPSPPPGPPPAPSDGSEEFAPH